jgi:glycosyltransferase involved in cell wall biosynthesis
LRATLSTSAPDLLHIHHWHNLSLRLIGIARDLGIPVVVTLHDLFVTCPLFFRLPDAAAVCAPDLPVATCGRCLARLVPHGEDILGQQVAVRHELFARELTRAQAVLALSVPQQQFLQQVPWLPVAVRALPLPAPPVPLPRIGWKPRPDGRLRLVNWGGLVPGKGLRTLVAAAESLPGPADIAIDHFGRVLDEAHAAELRSLAQRTRLRLCGPYDEDTMADVFPGYDAMVFPSLYLETHGFVVDEAMALGLPVIVTDRGAPQLRVGARGRVVPAGDVRALAAVLTELCRAPEMLVAMRAATPPPQPSWQTHLAELQACYASALADG